MNIVANLDCEWRMVRRHAATTVRALPAAVLERIAQYGTLLRIWAEPGDRLWLPAAIDPACMRTVPGVALPELDVGHTPPPTTDTRLVWCHESDAAARGNARAFSFQVGEALGCLLDGTQLLATASDVAAARYPSGAWVFKAAYAVAGRDHVRGEGPPRPDQVARITQLVERQGAGVLEPWVDRTLDLGTGSLPGLHVLEVGTGGGFQGIAAPAPDLPHAWRARLDEVRKGVAESLRALGHAGPWGLDAWVWRGPDGEDHLHPLGEVNARLTFGHVARAWFERVGRTTWGPDAAMALRFGEQPETRDPDTISLVGSPDGQERYAWLTRLAHARAWRSLKASNHS